MTHPIPTALWVWLTAATLLLLTIFVILLEILSLLSRLIKFIAPHISRLEITIMPKSIDAGTNATAHLVATDTKGNVYMLTASDTIALAAAVPADVTFGTPVFNADGSADVPVTGVNPDAGDAITATVDGVTSNADTLVITAPAPKVASVTLTLQ